MPRTQERPARIAAVIDPNGVYSLDDVAAIMGTSRRGIARAVKEDGLAYSRRGNRRVFLGQWVLEWIVAGKIAGKRVKGE